MRITTAARTLQRAWRNRKGRRMANAIRQYGRTRMNIRRYVRNPNHLSGAVATNVPHTQRVKLKYCDFKTLTVTSVPQIHEWAANSLYDPDYTGVGHQPMGYDEYMKEYNKWVVVGSTIKVVPMPNQTGAAPCPTVVGVRLSEVGSTYPTSITQAMEITPKWRMISDNISDGRDTVKINSIYDAKKYWGFKDLMDQDELFGQLTTDLEERRLCFYTVWVGSTTDAVELEPIRVAVEIIYDVIFSEPKTLGTS